MLKSLFSITDQQANSYTLIFISMRRFLLLICFAFVTCLSQAQTSQYDKKLADSLGADEHGMKPYILVILKTGSVSVSDKSIQDSLFRGHMANINRLATAGKLVVAGPLRKNGRSYRGLFILNVKTLLEATELLATDPAIHGKILDAELYEWYGSAALPLYLPSHEKIEMKKP